MNDTVSPGVNSYSSRVEPPAVLKPVILDLFAQQGQTPAEAERNYQWFFDEHAFSQLKLQVLSHHEPAGEVPVGVVAMIAREWSDEGAGKELALLGNLIVDQQHRSLGPAVKLMRETLETVSTSVDFCYLLPNKKAEPLLKRLGAVKLGELVRYAKPLKTRRILAQHARARRLAFLAPLLDLALALEEWIPRWFSVSLVLEPEAVPDARFDQLWQQCSRQEWLIGKRDAAYLRWRCTDYPKGKVRILAIRKKGEDELFGYIAYGQDHHRNIHIDDVLCRDGLAGLRPLLLAFLAFVRRHDARSVSVSFFGDERVVAVLRSLRMLPREGRPLYVAPGRDSVEQMQDKRWYLTQIDEDQ